MKEEYLISIIIPVYNVEKYIKKCITSCINQTYKNIEIIIVDDGSPDNSGKIADDFARKDMRIKVLHKKNNGVSEARNDGIRLATGEYLVFLDADDYLKKDFIEYMLSLAKKTEADFCLSLNCFTSSDQKQLDDHIRKISNIEGTTLLLSSRVEVGCWNKIFRTKFLKENNIKFSNQLYFGEGLEFITKAAQLSNHLGIGEKRVYYYRKNNLTSATTHFNYNKFLNGEKSLLKIKNDFIINDNKIISEWNMHYFLFCTNALINIINNNYIDDYKQKYKYWYNRIKTYTPNLLFNRNISIKKKLKIITVCILPHLVAYKSKIKRDISIKKSV